MGKNVLTFANASEVRAFMSSNPCEQVLNAWLPALKLLNFIEVTIDEINQCGLLKANNRRVFKIKNIQLRLINPDACSIVLPFETKYAKAYFENLAEQLGYRSRNQSINVYVFYDKSQIDLTIVDKICTELFKEEAAI